MNIFVKCQQLDLSLSRPITYRTFLYLFSHDASRVVLKRLIERVNRWRERTKVVCLPHAEVIAHPFDLWDFGAVGGWEQTWHATDAKHKTQTVHDRMPNGNFSRSRMQTRLGKWRLSEVNVCSFLERFSKLFVQKFVTFSLTAKCARDLLYSRK